MASSSRNQTPIKRLLTELHDYNRDGNPALTRLNPISDEDLSQWEAVMKGVEGTAYEGALFTLSLSIPPTYPLVPPTISFKTPIVHPNIHFRTGEICLDLLKTAWSPAYTLSSTLTAVQNLLTSAEPDSPLNVDIAQLFRAGDELGARSLIRWYVEREAVMEDGWERKREKDERKKRGKEREREEGWWR